MNKFRRAAAETVGFSIILNGFSLYCKKSKEEALRKTYPEHFDIYSRLADNLKIEYKQIVNKIVDSSAVTIRKHLDIPDDRMQRLSPDSITGCLNRLLGVDDFQSIKEENLLSSEDPEEPLQDQMDQNYRTVCDDAIMNLCDFSHEESLIASQPPNLLLAMLTVEGKKWNSVNYLQEKFEHTLSLPEQQFILYGAMKSPDEWVFTLVFLKCTTCIAFLTLTEKYWPVDAAPSLTGLIPNAFRFLKWSLGVSLGVIVLSPIAFELIKTQAAILRTHQNNAIAKKREEEQASQPVLSYSMKEKRAAAYQLQSGSPARVGSTVSLLNHNLYGRLILDWLNGYNEEKSARFLLFRSLLSYLHPALACLLCTVSSTSSCGSFNNEIYSGLDFGHSLSLKFFESLLMTMLSYVTFSNVPCEWARSILSWDSTFLDECLNLDDPFLNRTFYVHGIFKQIKFLLQLLPQPADADANAAATITEPLRVLAEEVMLEYSSPFGSAAGGSAQRTLTAEEREDFIVALEWACCEEVVQAMARDEAASVALPSAPLNYVSHLGAPINYFRGSTLLKMFTPRDCNSKVTQWWAAAMEKILLPDSAATPPATAAVPKSKNPHGPSDVDPLQSNSREYFSSQVQQIDRLDLTDSIAQKDVEALLLAAISDPAAPISTSIPSLSRSLLCANNMERDAFSSLLQDRYSFLNQTMDYYSPRILREFADAINTRYAGLCPPNEELEGTKYFYHAIINNVLDKADEIFLRSRGLTKRRFEVLLNKHSLDPEVKALQLEWDGYIEQKHAKNPEKFMKLCKWGY